ncbi:MAG: virulence protein RhuM/Fic/DOC family protein [Desulfuromonadaceae bacterium]|nr:virulence protein RhuM/Fic/DOC family protein [Desulfuromonadaceae bacterium]MDD2856617.1 virulence protein RhuM/Fic/DOC family protein [Desulfuromonadaceae bacterium]
MTLTTTDDVIIYKSPDGSASLDVRLDHETVWLSQAQLVELFKRDVSVISRHIRNVFVEGELDEVSNLQKMQIAGSTRPVVFYSLDVIISVGYRVKSKQGTQFRIWASKILKDHIVKGYTINEQRFREQAEKLTEMRRIVELLARTLTNQELVSETGKDLLRVITDYAYALNLLDRYDHGTLTIEEITLQALYVIDYDEAIGIVASMKGEFDGLFGIEKDQGFKSALGTIYQTFGGEELYPSIEEKGGNLLYFIVKNHAFSDGNKRIAAALFIYFLGRNGILYRSDGSKRLADNALVALTLLIAESRPDEKDTIVKVIVNLINRNND